jgi:hypothetical protein
VELIRWYIDTFETISKWQRTKQTRLEFLERHAIGKANALTLTAAALIDHALAAGEWRRPRNRHQRSGLDRGRAARGEERQGASCPA